MPDETTAIPPSAEDAVFNMPDGEGKPDKVEGGQTNEPKTVEKKVATAPTDLKGVDNLIENFLPPSFGVNSSATSNVDPKTTTIVKDDNSKLQQQQLEDKLPKEDPDKLESDETKESKVEEDTTKDQPQLEQQPVKRQRDYTGFTEQEISLLKKMPDATYDYVRPRLVERQNLQKTLREKTTEIENLKKGIVTIPDSYYENEEAYILTPEYSKAVDASEQTTQAYNHWRQQLINIEKGEPWTTLVKDKDTGRLVPGERYEASPESKAFVNEAIVTSRDNLRRIEAYADNLKNQHKQRAQETFNNVKAAEDKYYPQWSDIEASEDKELLTGIAKEVKETFKVSDKNPLFGLLIKSVAQNYKSAEVFKKMREASSKAQLLAKDRKLAGPTQSTIQTQSTNNGANKTKIVDRETIENYLRQ